MPLLSLILGLALIGVVVWLITRFIPMPEQFKQLIVVVAIIVCLLWVLSLFGVLPSLNAVRVGS